MPIFFFFKFWLAAIVIVVCLLHELEMCLAAANSDLDNQGYICYKSREEVSALDYNAQQCPRGSNSYHFLPAALPASTLRLINPWLWSSYDYWASYQHYKPKKVSSPNGVIFFFFLLLIGGQWLYSVVLVSAIQQHESAIRYQPYHTYVPSLLNLSLSPNPIPPLEESQSTSLSSLPLAICFTYDNVYISVLASQFIPHSPSPFESISSLFSMSVPLFLSSKQAHQYHFSRFHIYTLIYDMCVSLSNLFHSIADSKFIHLSTTDLNLSLLWLSNISLYIPQLLYPQMMSFLSVKQVLSKKCSQQNFSISVAGTITKLCSTLRV